MTTARPIPSARRRGHALAGMAFACALILLAACGGGGGGGGEAAYKLRLATTNETAEPITVTVAVDEVPGEPQTLETCKATLFTFDIPADGNHCCHNIYEVVRPRMADWLAERLGGRT